LVPNGDDRRHCAQCWNLSGRRCRTRGVAVLDDLPRRCLDYIPTAEDPDQRTGFQRFVWLTRQCEVNP
jgi:hypothetical protein